MMSGIRRVKGEMKFICTELILVHLQIRENPSF